MAIDTRRKRQAALQGSALPMPDGSLTQSAYRPAKAATLHWVYWVPEFRRPSSFPSIEGPSTRSTKVAGPSTTSKTVSGPRTDSTTLS